MLSKPNRVRGGRKDRPSRAYTFAPHKGPSLGQQVARSNHRRIEITPTALAADESVYFQCSDVVETEATHVIPRFSLTEDLMLPVARVRELETITTRQPLRDETGKILLSPSTLGDPVPIMVEVGNGEKRVTFSTPKTLLRRERPFQYPDDFARLTSRSKIVQRAPYRNEGKDHDRLMADLSQKPHAPLPKVIHRGKGNSEGKG